MNKGRRLQRLAARLRGEPGGGELQDEYLYTRDGSLSPAEATGLYCGRWNLETTFQEGRSHLGVGTTMADG